jgi:hypothetical protein
MLRGVVASVFLVMLVAGCASQGDVAARMVAEDSAKCKQMVGDQNPAYTDCMNRMMAYRQQVQSDADNLGSRLQRAGAALQSVH